MPKKLTQEEFIARAKSVHGNKYDYSKVVYVNKETPVEIICPVHGSFMQIAGNHIRGKGCAKCKPNYKMTQEDFIAKANQVHHNKYDYSETKFTKCADYVIIRCPEHGYFKQIANSHLMGHGCPKCGYEHQFESEEEKQENYAKRVITRQETCIDRYGVSNPMQVDDIKERMIETVVGKYGVKNVASLQEIQDKRKQTNVEKYGATSYMGSNVGKSYMKNLMYDKYGVDNYAKTEECHIKINNTKRLHGTFNTSSQETNVYDVLLELFGQNNVATQYHDSRYPFLCDFHIGSRDLFIELNVFWSHGFHWFEQISVEDLNKLNIWQIKSRDMQIYKKAIETWTVRDVLKRKIAADNKLNYLTFWREDLSDFDEWIDAGCPNGKDWDRMYSWRG